MKTLLRYLSALLLACTFAVSVTACTGSDDSGDTDVYAPATSDTTGSDTTGTGGGGG